MLENSVPIKDARRPRTQWRTIVAGTVVITCLLVMAAWYLWRANPRPIRVESVKRLIEHNDPMIVGAVSADGQFLAISDFKHIRRVPTQVFVWSLASPIKRLGEFKGPKMQCQALCFHPKRPLLAIAGEGGIITVVDVQQHTVAQHIEVHGDLPTLGPRFDFREVRSLSFSPDGTTLAVGTGRGEVEIWSTTGWRRLYTLPRHSEEVNDLAFSADGERLISVGGRWEMDPVMKRQPEIFIWDADSWEKVGEIEVTDPARFAKHVCFVGETMVVVGFHSGHLILADAVDREVIGQLVGHQNMISDMSYDDQRNLLLTSSPTETIVWDMKCWSEARRLPGATFVAYDPNTGLLAMDTGLLAKDRSRRSRSCVLFRVSVVEQSSSLSFTKN